MLNLKHQSLRRNETFNNEKKLAIESEMYIKGIHKNAASD